jgi:hypothetical protein
MLPNIGRRKLRSTGFATLHVQVGVNSAATPAPPSTPTANTNKGD